jgi:hypothetical protein
MLIFIMAGIMPLIAASIIAFGTGRGNSAVKTG